MYNEYHSFYVTLMSRIMYVPEDDRIENFPETYHSGW